MYYFVPILPWHWEMIPAKARPRKCEDTRGIVAQDETGKLVAACVLDTWSFNSCQIHIFIDNPFVLKNGFAEEVFKFAFSEESGREVVIGITPEDNKQALKFIRHIGFEDIGRVPDGYKKGVDYILTAMRKEKCRWIDQPAVEDTAHG